MTDITVDKATIALALEAIELNWRTDEGDAVTPILRAALAEPAPVQEPDAIGCKCSVCGEWQRWTPSGMVCKNGHGGADGVNHRLYTASAERPVQEPETDVRKIMLAVVPGFDGMGAEVYAKSTKDVEDKLSALGSELEEWQLGIRRLPAPVQEQQPAPASKPVLLQCLGCERVGTQEQLSASTDCDCWLHTQPAPVQEPQPVVVQRKIRVDSAGCEYEYSYLHAAQPRKADLVGLKVSVDVSTGDHDADHRLFGTVTDTLDTTPLTLLCDDARPNYQPRKAVKLSDSEIASDASRHWSEDGVDPIAFAHAIESAVWAKNGWAE